MEGKSGDEYGSDTVSDDNGTFKELSAKTDDTSDQMPNRLTELKDLDSLPSSDECQTQKTNSSKRKKNKIVKNDVTTKEFQPEATFSRIVHFKKSEYLSDCNSKNSNERSMFLSEPASDEFVTFSSASGIFDGELLPSDKVLQLSNTDKDPDSAFGAVKLEFEAQEERNDNEKIEQGPSRDIMTNESSLIRDTSKIDNSNSKMVCSHVNMDEKFTIPVSVDENTNKPMCYASNMNLSLNVPNDGSLLSADVDGFNLTEFRDRNRNIELSSSDHGVEQVDKLEIEKRKSDNITQKKIEEVEAYLLSLPLRKRINYIVNNYSMLSDHLTEKIVSEMLNVMRDNNMSNKEKTLSHLTSLAPASRVEYIRKNYDELMSDLSQEDIDSIIKQTDEERSNMENQIKDSIYGMGPREKLDYLLKNYDNFTKVVSNQFVNSYVECAKEEIRGLEHEENKKEIKEYLYSLPPRKRYDYIKSHYDSLAQDLDSEYIRDEIAELETNEKENEIQISSTLDNMHPKDRIEYLKTNYNSLSEKVSSLFIEAKISESKEVVKNFEINERKQFVIDNLNSLQPRKKFEYIHNQREALLMDLDLEYIEQELANLLIIEAEKKEEIEAHLETLPNPRDKHDYIMSNYKVFSEIVSDTYLDSKIDSFKEMVREERRKDLSEYLSSLPPRKCAEYIESHRDTVDTELGEEVTAGILERLNQASENEKRALYERLSAFPPNARLEYLLSNYKELSEMIDERSLDRHIEATKEDLKVLQEEDVKKKSQNILSTLSSRKKLEYIETHRESLYGELGKSYINSEYQALIQQENQQKSGIVAKLKNKSPADSVDYLLSRYIELSELVPKQFLDDLISKYKEDARKVEVSDPSSLEEYLSCLPNRKRLEFILSHYNSLSEDLSKNYLDSEIEQLTNREKEEKENLTKILSAKHPKERLDYIITNYKSLSDEISEQYLNECINFSKEQAKKQEANRKMLNTQNYLKSLSPRKRRDYIISHYESLALDLDRDYLDELINDLDLIVKSKEQEFDEQLKSLSPRQQYQYLRTNYSSLSEHISEEYIERKVESAKNEAERIENEESVNCLKSYITSLSPCKRKDYIISHYSSLKEELGTDFLNETMDEIEKFEEDEINSLALKVSSMSSKEALNYLLGNFRSLTESVPEDVINSHINAQREKIKQEEAAEKKRDFEAQIEALPLRPRQNYIVTNYKRLISEFDQNFVDEKIKGLKDEEIKKQGELDNDLASKSPRERYIYLLRNYNTLTDSLSNEYVDGKIESAKAEVNNLERFEKRRDIEKVLNSLAPQKRRDFIASHYDTLSSDFGNDFVESEIQALDYIEKKAEDSVLSIIENLPIMDRYKYLVDNYQKLLDNVSSQFLESIVDYAKDELKKEKEERRKTTLCDYIKSLLPRKRRDYIQANYESLSKDFGKDQLESEFANIVNEVEEAKKLLIQDISSMSVVARLDYLISEHNRLSETFDDAYLKDFISQTELELENQDQNQRKEDRMSYVSSLPPVKRLHYITINFDSVSRDLGEDYAKDEIEKIHEQSKLMESELNKKLSELTPHEKLQYLLDNYNELADVLSSEVLDCKLSAAGEEAASSIKVKKEGVSMKKERRRSIGKYIISLSPHKRLKYFTSHFNELSIEFDSVCLDSEVETMSKSQRDDELLPEGSNDNVRNRQFESFVKSYDDPFDTTSSRFQESCVEVRQNDNDDNFGSSTKDLKTSSLTYSDSDTIYDKNKVDDTLQPARITQSSDIPEVAEPSLEIPNESINYSKSRPELIRKILAEFKPRHRYDYIKSKYDCLFTDVGGDYLNKELEKFANDESKTISDLSNIDITKRRDYIMKNYSKLLEIIKPEKIEEILTEIPGNDDALSGIFNEMIGKEFTDKINSIGPHTRVQYLQENYRNLSEIYGKGFIDDQITKSKQSEKEARDAFRSHLSDIKPEYRLRVINETYNDISESLGVDFLDSEIEKELANAKNREEKDKQDRNEILRARLSKLPVRERLDYIVSHYDELTTYIDTSQLDQNITLLQDSVKENENKLQMELSTLSPSKRVDRLLGDYVSIYGCVGEQFFNNELDKARVEREKFGQERMRSMAHERLNEMKDNLSKMSLSEQRGYIVQRYSSLIKHIDKDVIDKMLNDIVLKDDENKRILLDVLSPMNPQEKREYLTTNYETLCDKFDRSFVEDIVVQNRADVAKYYEQINARRNNLRTTLEKLVPLDKVNRIESNREELSDECGIAFINNELAKARSDLDAQELRTDALKLENDGQDTQMLDVRRRILNLKEKLNSIGKRQQAATDSLLETSQMFSSLEENSVRTRRSLDETIKKSYTYQEIIRDLVTRDQKY